MADARERFVLRALRIVLRWFRDVTRSYLIQRKALIDSFTVVSGQKTLTQKQNEASNGKNYSTIWVGFE